MLYGMSSPIASSLFLGKYRSLVNYVRAPYIGLVQNPFNVGDTVDWHEPTSDDEARAIEVYRANHGKGPYVVESITHYDPPRGLDVIGCPPMVTIIRTSTTPLPPNVLPYFGEQKPCFGYTWFTLVSKTEGAAQ